MRGHTNYQIISHDGRPTFVLVPVEEFEQIRPDLEKAQALKHGIPDEVVRANIMEDVPLIRAWREYLGFTQAEVAGRMGISQSALAQMESPDAKPRKTTLLKLARALGLTPEQLAA
jgi:DNA-binding XRE family transcriptional regulator